MLHFGPFAALEEFEKSLFVCVKISNNYNLKIWKFVEKIFESYPLLFAYQRPVKIFNNINLQILTFFAEFSSEPVALCIVSKVRKVVFHPTIVLCDRHWTYKKLTKYIRDKFFKGCRK